MTTKTPPRYAPPPPPQPPKQAPNISPPSVPSLPAERWNPYQQPRKSRP
jgi:hypothetical protein